VAIGVRCADGGIELASAGSPRPLLVGGTERVRELAVAGPMAGAKAMQKFETVPVEVEAGGALVAATDGAAARLRDRLAGGELEEALALDPGDDDATVVIAR